MLIITGTGRCGTSVLARFCHSAGFIVGGSWNHEANSGMEDSRFVETSKTITTTDGNVGPECLKFIDRFPRLVVKDPRFLQPSVIRLWADRRDDLKLIICVRDMAHVAESFARSGLKDRDQLEWATTRSHEIISAFVEIGRKQIPFRFLSFPYFLDEYEMVHGILNDWAGLPINFDRGRIVWNGLIDKNKVHFK